MTAELTDEDVRQLGEAREILTAVLSLTAKPGPNKTLQALNKFIGLADQKLEGLHSVLSNRLKE